MTSWTPELAIPPEVLQAWQRIVDLLASILHVPSAVVTMLEPPQYTHYRILASSTSEGNPFPIGDCFAMDIGTFCETVINSREPLLVPDALEDRRWQSAPELRVGMVSYLGYPVLWPDGRMFGTICVLDDKANGYGELYQEVLRHCRDVLEGDLQTLARLGSALEEERAHLGELFTRVPAAVVMVAHDSRITRVNPAFTGIFGYTAEEALGRRIRDLITPDDLQEEFDGFLDRMVRSGDVFTAETVRRHKNGTRVPVAMICVPVSSRAGGDAGYVIYRDLTESKRFEAEQRRYHEMQLELAHANRIATIGQLSASIAHELTQPLTGITTNCGTCLRMLAGDSPNLDGVRAAVQRTLRDANRASEVLTRLRALYGKREATAEVVDLNEAIREVITLSLGELREGRVTVRKELADDLPPVTGDRVQLQQVVLNLLLNALEAMKDVEDRPRDLVIRTERQEGERVGVSVRDSGSGFDPLDGNRLFEAFYTTKSDGMGMGLSVSRAILERHHGRLWAEPNDGPGATFAFSVPCRGDTSVQ